MSIEIGVPQTTINDKVIDVEYSNKNTAIAEGTKEMEVSVNRREYSIVGDELYIPKRYEDAPQWLRDIIDTVTNASISGALSDVSTLGDMLNGLIAELNVAKNTYTQSIISDNDIDERINTAITTLNSTLANADSTVLDIALTRVTPEEAETIATNILSASIAGGDISAAVQNLQTAIADVDNARAQDYIALNASIGDEFESTAAAISTINAYVGIDEAGASTGTGLSAYLEDSNGVIGGADSELNNTIRATAEGIESKFEYNSIVNINGIYKKSGFGLTTNYTSGNGTEAKPYVSEFWIDASRLRFTNSNQTGQATPFLIDASGTQPKVTFNGLVTFGSGQTGTIEEAIASTIETVQVGDKNINITDNLIPTTSLVGDSNNAGYQFVGAPIKSYVAGIDSFAEAQVALSSGDEVYSMYVDELTVPYYFRFGIKGITSLDNFKVVTLDSLDTVTYGVVTVTMLDSYSVDANEWYVVDGIINPSGGSTTASGAIRLSNGTKVGEINNYVTPSGSTKLLLGWTGACTISRMKLAKITADTITADYASKDYVSTSISESGYVRPEEVANAINTNTTTIEGSKITTGSIAADKINTTGLIAETISATDITGITINGGIINGARINGAVIKASYLDLDGELEVLTNYIITVAMYNANPSLYTDAVYISADNQYRIPSLSAVREGVKSTTLSSNGRFANGIIGSYDKGNSGNNNKAVKIIPYIMTGTDYRLISSSGYISDRNTLSSVYGFGTSFILESTHDIYFGNILIATVQHYMKFYGWRAASFTGKVVVTSAGSTLVASVYTSSSTKTGYTMNGYTYRASGNIVTSEFTVAGGFRFKAMAGGYIDGEHMSETASTYTANTYRYLNIDAIVYSDYLNQSFTNTQDGLRVKRTYQRFGNTVVTHSSALQINNMI